MMSTLIQKRAIEYSQKKTTENAQDSTIECHNNELTNQKKRHDMQSGRNSMTQMRHKLFAVFDASKSFFLFTMLNYGFNLKIYSICSSFYYYSCGKSISLHMIFYCSWLKVKFIYFFFCTNLKKKTVEKH